MENNEQEKAIIPKFIIIESQILLNFNLTPTEKLIYGFITVLCNNKNGGCYANNKYLSRITGLKTRQLQYCLKNLKKYNYITITISNNNKRLIVPTINVFLESRKDNNIATDILDYDWLNNE